MMGDVVVSVTRIKENLGKNIGQVPPHMEKELIGEMLMRLIGANLMVGNIPFVVVKGVELIEDGQYVLFTVELNDDRPFIVDPEPEV